jgi:hypothetical protein
MEIMRLDPITYVPDLVMDNFSSKIWTERFRSPGDFEFVTANIAETLELLPIGSFVTHRATTVPMRVESRTLSISEEGQAKLTITGRTIETFLENRIMVPTVYNDSWYTYAQYEPDNLLMVLLWTYLVNTTGKDPTRLNYNIDNKTWIPNLVISDESYAWTGPQTYQELSSGTVYDKVQELLAAAPMGIKGTYAVSGNYGDVITVDVTNTANHGKITKVYGPIPGKMELTVYTASDRSVTADGDDSVMLRYDTGDISESESLFSDKNYRNFVTVISSAGQFDVWPATTPPPDTSVTGLARRPILLDGGNQGTQDLTKFNTSLTYKAKALLRKHAFTQLADANIVVRPGKGYKVNYYLGDVITLVDPWGIQTDAMVSEYVWSEDESGEKNYPGFEPPFLW